MRVTKLDPEDADAKRKQVALSSTELIEKSFTDKGSTREVQQQSAYDADRSRGEEPRETVAPGESYEEDLKRAIRKEPKHRDHYTKLGDFYRREDRLDDAATLYRQALKISDDQNIREIFEDIQLDRMRKQIDEANEELRTKPDDEEARKSVASRRADLTKKEIQVLAQRVERYPANSRLKLELGRKYMMFRKWDLAIPLLQRASADNRLEAEARSLLGECFLQDGKKKLARTQFAKVVDLVNEHDEQELFLKAHYVLGRLAEDEGDTNTADSHYSEVLAIDYDFRDTRHRLEKLHG
jgi:Flp pilus assembly protein TadD